MYEKRSEARKFSGTFGLSGIYSGTMNITNEIFRDPQCQKRSALTENSKNSPHEDMNWCQKGFAVSKKKQTKLFRIENTCFF